MRSNSFPAYWLMVRSCASFSFFLHPSTEPFRTNRPSSVRLLNISLELSSFIRILSIVLLLIAAWIARRLASTPRNLTTDTSTLSGSLRMSSNLMTIKFPVFAMSASSHDRTCCCQGPYPFVLPRRNGIKYSLNSGKLDPSLSHERMPTGSHLGCHVLGK